jgi:HSP20 family molecular chaperone IbpA
MDTISNLTVTTAPAFLQRNDNLFARVIDWNVLNSPNADFTDEGDKYRLRILAPGLSRKDFSIETDERIMKVSLRDISDDTSHYRATFRRSFLLPWNADATNIKARCRNSMLVIDVGKVNTWVNKHSKGVKGLPLFTIDRMQRLTKGLWSKVRSIATT